MATFDAYYRGEYLGKVQASSKAAAKKVAARRYGWGQTDPRTITIRKPKSNPSGRGKAIKLKNFTGVVRVNPGGTSLSVDGIGFRVKPAKRNPTKKRRAAPKKNTARKKRATKRKTARKR